MADRATAARADFRTGLGYELVLLMRAHRNAVAARLGDVGLHVGQEMLLARLWQEDGRSQVELARDMGVEPPTVAKAVARLERGGMLERRADGVDRRVTRVWLTDAGRALREPVVELWRDVERQMFTGIEDDELETVRAVARRMAANLAGISARAPDC
jgi:DNA-binding MarR family transcriptional regulator